ncbi:HEAT repeat domain-containing protein [Roseofilum reptotaenium CS-1145]|uniref:Uncharacterized protein n=1 Tax=Roseofilum reptotaenium AO1-A TaxID=1925591 RepID=A0A1L9QM18_9CYAN|nr:HEAT repeat domain-containing protein [Roseofilum reptotaenium]MDB9519842.1 HEAT repeat domain-containing protein [Roseofilum reptotaenium CS-1145]OJJ20743.1 hypothetical protein BI308_20335 [Roseofilum reptotaenium AO1-A]
MIDPLSGVLLPVLINFVTGRADAKVLAPGLDEQLERLQQRQIPLNHDVEKELRRSFFLALKQLAVQCQKQLESLAEYNQGSLEPGLVMAYEPTPRNQAARDLDWLKAKVRELEQVIDKVDEIVDREQGETPSQLSYSGDVRALLEGQNLQENPAIQAFQQQYLPGFLEGAPQCYLEAIQKQWLSLIRDNFVQRLKDNDKVFRVFVQQSLNQLQIEQDQILKAIHDLIKAPIIARLDPQHPELNEEDWATVAKLRLAEEQALTSNLFTREDGVELNRLDVYVPLGLVERRKPERLLPFGRNDGDNVIASGTQWSEAISNPADEKITPISEDRFFTDVLQQGKSPQSGGKCLAIIGEPGSGKTTRLQAISQWILDNYLGLPIWVSLRTLQGRSLRQYLDDWLNDATGKPALKENFQQQFNQGRVWLLLDGLDEMTAHITRDHQDWVKGWWATAQTRILITCRVNVWDANRDALNGFDVFRNLEFSQSEVEDYIERWFQGAKDAEGGQALCSTVQSEEHSHLQDLIRNPLRLSLLCCVWHQEERSLPETRAGLYEKFVEQVYQWKSEMALAEKKRPQLHQKLGELALRAIDGKDKEGNFSQFWLRESWLKQVFGALDNDLCQAALRLGWLNRLGKDGSETVYGFYHATFQEYFAALAVEDGDYFLPQNHEDFPVAGKEYRIFAPQWKQVILFWLGRGDVAEEKKEAFIGQLVNFEDGCYGDFYEYRAYFLAAAGITEFKAYSRPDEIVQQIVQWGFGDFNEEQPEWRSFIDPIEKGARYILPETDRQHAIEELFSLLKHSQCPEDICRQAAHSIGKLDPGNKNALSVLVQLLEQAKDKDSLREVAESLGEIGSRNVQGIAALVKLLRQSIDEDTRETAAYILGKIDPGNKEAIASLVELLEQSTDEDIPQIAAYALEDIGQGNPDAITALVQVLEQTEDEDTRCWVAQSLGQIDPGNKDAIAILVKILEQAEDEDTRCWVARSLGQIDPGNKDAIAFLVELLEQSTDEDTRKTAAYALEDIGQGNPDAITALVQVLEQTEDEDTRCWLAQRLEKIDPGNKEAINALVKLLKQTMDELTYGQAAYTLGQIDPGNPDAIAALVKLLEQITDEDSRWGVAHSLGSTDPGNLDAIAALVQLLAQTKNQFLCIQAAYSLGQIITTEEQQKSVVSALQPHLNDETYDNNFGLFHNCYELFWKIAQTLSYPDFYQAWHGSLPAPINLAEFPQILRAALPEPHSWQLLMIDGSTFNPDNPVRNLYRQMLQQGCPESENGKPKDMADLQDYWEDLLDNSNPPLALIFYENPQPPAPQGFSDTFLEALTRFQGKGKVCVVTEQPHPSLQTFSPNDPRLIKRILAWLERSRSPG